MKYRPEIDGLRALAIMPVIFFHADFKLFSGGFIGVDVFFVISGYLITTILINDIENDRFSIIDFYERRARRILPALFLVMLVCIPFAFAWMLPNQLKDFSQSLVAVSIFSSNILFWLESGYFEAETEEKPLLHTWSLSVEEQFYLLFPIFLILGWRFGKNKLLFTIVIMAVLSLLASEWGWRNHPTANFYLAPYRAWEIFAGSIAAFLVRQQGVKRDNILATIGLSGIIFSIFFYDQNTPFPSVFTMVPVLGAVLLVMYAHKETIVAKLLSIKGIVQIGLLSYSAYLWHQPLFSFARIKSLEAPTATLMLSLSFVSFGFAYLSWRFVEMPFRNKAVLKRKSMLFFSLCTLVGFIFVGYQGHTNEGFRDRLNISETVYDSLSRSKRQDECFGKTLIQEDNWFCNVGSASSMPTTFIFGDSHALSFLPAVDKALSLLNQGGLFVGTTGCIPFLGIHSLREDQLENNCNELNKRVFKYIKDSSIETIILVSRWAYYTDGDYEGENLSYIGLTETDKRNRAASRLAFEYGLRKTLSAYAEIDVDVVVVAQVPQQHRQPLEIYAASSLNGESLTINSIPRSHHLSLQSFVTSLFNAEGIKLLDFTDEFCGPSHCTVGTVDSSYYYDDDHLSISGSALLVGPLIDFLSNAWIGQGANQ